MSVEEDKLYNYLSNIIINNNKFNISSIKELKNIKASTFDKEEYNKIKGLISEKNIEGIIRFPSQNIPNNEYLNIYTFIDQDSNRFIVTVYDNDLPWQDIDIIDLFKI